MAPKDASSINSGAAFDRYLADLYPNEEARERFRRRVRAVHLATELMRAMDDIRQAAGVSKVTVAARMKRNPAAVSRLFTSPDANPTVTTLIEMLDALEFRLEVSVKPQAKEPARRLPPILIKGGTSRHGSSRLATV
jgi:DNA-binding phage protein